mmetsp:Transcript_2645/g.6828  ORF Transcript_2645/g.6828 Transcript_2645/m.6828 type:complete len:375 (-) Transcript_2645:62-1186(-)
MEFEHFNKMKQAKGSLWKISSRAAFDAAAWSSGTIKGWESGVSFVVAQTKETQAYFIGLVHKGEDDPSNNAGYSGIDFAVEVDARAGRRCVCTAWERGRVKASMGEALPGDTVAIAMNKGVVEFRINGEVKTIGGAEVRFPLCVKVCACYAGLVPVESLQWMVEQPVHVCIAPEAEQLRTENAALKSSLRAEVHLKSQQALEIQQLQNLCAIHMRTNEQLNGIIAREKVAMDQLQQQFEAERLAKVEAEAALARSQLEVQELEAKCQTEQLSRERLAAERAKEVMPSKKQLKAQSKRTRKQRSKILWSILSAVLVASSLLFCWVFLWQQKTAKSELPSFTASTLGANILDGSIPNSGVYTECVRLALGDSVDSA